jgi:hypothetical protein
MSERIGKASLTMHPPRRVVIGKPFHVGRPSLSSPFDEYVGRIDENLDPGGRQAHICRARLLLLTRHSFVEKEDGALVESSNSVKVHNCSAPSASMYQLSAAVASATINITERTGRAAVLLIAFRIAQSSWWISPSRPTRRWSSRPPARKRNLLRHADSD